MAFAHPEAWLWALLALPLLLAHLWTPRPRIVHVPAAFLWREALGSEPSRLWRLGRRCVWLGVDGIALLFTVAAVAEPATWSTGWKALAAAALGVVAAQTIAVLRRIAPLRPPLWLALRGAMLLALAAALTGPTIGGLARPVYAVFLIDHSASIAPQAQEAARHFVARAVAGRNHWAEVRFAEKSWLARSEESDPPATSRQATDLEAALAMGSRIAPPTCAPHIVLLSDGIATQGDGEAAVEAARRAGIPISTVPLASCDPEVYVAEVQMPSIVREREPFEALVAIRSTREEEGELEVASASGVLSRQRVRVPQGEHWQKVPLRLDAGPEATLSVRVRGFGDTLAENNAQDAAVTVLPPRRALLVESRAESSRRLVKALRNGNLAVEVRNAADLPETLAGLAPCDAVALVNIPAAALTPRQMANLAAYVRGGGGLVAIGGDQAFVPGGYRNTALEAVLPVESEPTRKTPRSGLAIVFVVDRSQSMEDGGAIDLARDAVRRAAELLGPEDHVGVLAFDEHSRWVSPIEPLADKARLLERIGSITAGGRTDMAPALQKAYLALRESFATEKHIVVLTDGISHPADFEALAEQIAGDGITLSTVALGREASRPLLEDMARLGKGRAYVCESPQAVPSVLTLETARASRLGVREEPFFPSPADRPGPESRGDQDAVGRFSPAGLNLTGAPALLGYAQTRLKPGAVMTLAAAGGDPLLAWWRCGEGVCAAFTADVENRWAAAWLVWPGFDRFWTSVVHGVLRREREGTVVLNRFFFSFPDEFRLRPTDHGLLQRMAARTGGTYQPDPESVWSVPNPGVLPPTPLHGWLLVLAAILLVPDAAARRPLLG